MALGQPLTARCPKCRQKGNGLTAMGRERRREYIHGHNTGLPTSTHQYRVSCNGCGYCWWSRHPDAVWEHNKLMKGCSDER